MSSLGKYLAEEKSLLQELSAECAPEYRDEALRSFVESSLLPEGSFNLLMMADGAQTAEVLQNLALSAYDCFVAGYLKQVSAYAALTVAELAGEEMPSLLLHSIESEQLDHLLGLFKEIGSEDPVLDWYVKEGAAIINSIRTKISITEVEALASLVRQLEYNYMLFSSDTGDIESYSFIIDIPERLSADISELGLFKQNDEIKRSDIFWVPDCIEGIWEQDASQLISSWENINLGLTHIGAFQTLNQCIETTIPVETDVVEVNIENVNVGIDTKVTDKEGTDGQADDCHTSRAAA